MICLDSDVIIDYLNGKLDAVAVINKHINEIVTTELSVFEVFHGIYLKKNLTEKEEEIANSFFNSITVLPFDKMCGKISAKIFTSLEHRGMQIEQNDCLIAAIILKNGFGKIITKNNKHFSRIKKLEVIGY